MSSLLISNRRTIKATHVLINRAFALDASAILSAEKPGGRAGFPFSFALDDRIMMSLWVMDSLKTTITKRNETPSSETKRHRAKRNVIERNETLSSEANGGNIELRG